MSRKLTAKEATAIHKLQMLAEKWPESLALFSAASQLLVIDKETSEILATIWGIPNDGGDPDSHEDDDGTEYLNID